MLSQFRLFTILITVLALTFTLPAQESNKYELSFAEATEQFQAGDYDSARVSLQNAIDQSASFSADDSRGPLARSFLAIVEMKRGRMDRSEELHSDALSMLSLGKSGPDPDLQLVKTRLAEFYLEDKSWGDANRYFKEVIENEGTVEQPNLLLLARSQWGLAQSSFASKNWREAGRVGYFARQTLQKVYGRDSIEQSKPFPIIIESAIRLQQYSNSRLWLEEYQALLDPETAPPSELAKLNRLKILYDTEFRKQQESDLVSSRQRVAKLLEKGVSNLPPTDVGYVLTTEELEKLKEEFNPTERKAPGGSMVQYGTNNTADVAFVMAEQNRIISKAVLAISMNSTLHQEEALHPSLIMFSTLFFDPGHDPVIEWLNERAFEPESTLEFGNLFNHDEKQVRFSVDKENSLYIFEFYPNQPDA